VWASQIAIAAPPPSACSLPAPALSYFLQTRCLFASGILTSAACGSGALNRLYDESKCTRAGEMELDSDGEPDFM